MASTGAGAGGASTGSTGAGAAKRPGRGGPRAPSGRLLVGVVIIAIVAFFTGLVTFFSGVAALFPFLGVIFGAFEDVPFILQLLNVIVGIIMMVVAFGLFRLLPWAWTIQLIVSLYTIAVTAYAIITGATGTAYLNLTLPLIVFIYLLFARRYFRMPAPKKPAAA